MSETTTPSGTGPAAPNPKPVSWAVAIGVGLMAGAALRSVGPRTQVIGTSLRREQKADTATGSDAGRQASTPKELPPRSWIDILKRVAKEIGHDRVLSVAASVTFYTLLAMFPAIVALVSLYGLFADPASISEHLNALTSFLPGGALDVIGEQVKRIASKPSGSLSFGFAIGLVTALWSANAGVKAMFDALNIVYDEEEKRSFVVLNAITLAFTVAALGFLLLALGAVVVMPIIFKLIPLPPVFETTLSLARWPVLLICLAGALAVLYRLGPSRQKPRWRWVTWGSAVAAFGWVIGSVLFSWYVSKFGSYNETYGSLGAAIGFMTWIWISVTIVLVGAEINAEMEHQTAQDTTEGGDKPMGSRGAAMADRVA